VCMRACARARVCVCVNNDILSNGKEMNRFLLKFFMSVFGL